MKRLRFKALLGLSILQLIATHASAQTAIPSPYRFIDEKQAGAVYVGYLWTNEGSLGLVPKSSPIFGGRYSIRLAVRSSLKPSLGYFSMTRAVLDTVVVIADSSRARVGTADFAALVANGGFRFNFTGLCTWHSLNRSSRSEVVWSRISKAAKRMMRRLQPMPASISARVSPDSSAAESNGFLQTFYRAPDARNLIWKIKTPSAFLLGDIGDRTPGDEWVQNGFFAAAFSLHF